MNSRSIAIMLLSVIAAPLGAVTIGVSNLGQPDQQTIMLGRFFGTQEYRFATSFSTGPGNFYLEGITLPFGLKVGDASGYSVAIYSAVSSSGPSGLVTTLVGNSTPSNSVETYAPNIPTTLLGNTTYWIVEQATTTAPSTAFGAIFSTSSNENPGGLPGWSIADHRWVTNDGGAVWFEYTSNPSPRQISVQIASVGDAGRSIVLLGISLVGLVWFRRKR